MIADRKARGLVRYQRARKRAGERLLDEAALQGRGSSSANSPLAQIPSQEPSPEFAVHVAEEYPRLLALVQDPELEKIAVLKMEGYTIKEIAKDLDCVGRTVQRRLQLIRRIWKQELPA